MSVQHVNTLRGEGDDEEVRFIETNTLVPWRQDTVFTVIGRGKPRVEGEAKVTGRACYAYDIRLPGQLYASILRSPYAHACIRRLDSSRAEALPGVHAVLSYANAPQIPWYDNSLLFDPTVRFVGDEVAAVAAESEDIARDALRLIEVEYEPQPFVVTMEAALQADCPQGTRPGQFRWGTKNL